MEKIAVGTLHRRKHVDMKHLKKCIWELLSSGGAPEALTFDTLLSTCPSRLPRTVQACISAPLLFNAVLHLTNERSLVLTQNDKKADFSIRQ